MNGRNTILEWIAGTTAERFTIPALLYAVNRSRHRVDRDEVIRVLERECDAGRIRMNPDGTWSRILA